MKARPNRRRQEGTVWTRLPKPPQIADACGRALRRSVPALVGAGVLAAVGGAAWGGYELLTSSPRFAITNIEVRGTRQLSEDHVRAMLPVEQGDNVFATDLDGVVREVRANPWVASVEARRELPHTLVVEIREHVPAALAQLGGLYLVTETGHAFKRAELAADEGAGLPIITGLTREAYVADPKGTGAQIRAALAALETWQADGERPSIGEVHIGSHGTLTLVTYEQAISIELGRLDATLATRMHTFDATWAELSRTERDKTRAIHLDARSDQVTVAFDPKDS